MKTQRPHVCRSLKRRKNGFTLIELLVVIAIIGVLVAMLLPAVQQAREAARRVNCRNNLMQIGLAVLNYRLAHEVLPPGVVNATGPIKSQPDGYHVSWIVQILPYLERNNEYRHFDFNAGVYDEKNAAVRSAVVEVLACPSYSFRGGDDVAKTNYAGCHSDTETPIDAQNKGVFFLNSALSTDDITDGLSSTIFVGEKLVFENDLGWVSGTASTLRNAGTAINTDLEKSRWSRAPFGDGQEPPGPLHVGGFGSYHTGGAQFVFGDGAVRMLSQHMDLTTLQRLANRADGELTGEF